MAAKNKQTHQKGYVRNYVKHTSHVIGTVPLTRDVYGGYHDPSNFWAKGTTVEVVHAIKSPIGPRFRIKGSIRWVGSEDIDTFKAIS